MCSCSRNKVWKWGVKASDTTKTVLWIQIRKWNIQRIHQTAVTHKELRADAQLCLATASNRCDCFNKSMNWSLSLTKIESWFIGFAIICCRRIPHLCIFKGVATGIFDILGGFVIALRVHIYGTGCPRGQKLLPDFLNASRYFSDGTLL